jgi:uncharacterized protein
MTERQGIEIDYCPQCRGVWLDRGELDKLIERAGSVTMPRPQSQDYDDEERGGGHMPNHRSHGTGHRRERENPIGELFDFF